VRYLAGLRRSLHRDIRPSVSVLCLVASRPRAERVHEASRQRLYDDALVRVLRCLLHGGFIGMTLWPELCIHLERLPAQHVNRTCERSSDREYLLIVSTCGYDQIIHDPRVCAIRSAAQVCMHLLVPAEGRPSAALLPSLRDGQS